MLPVIGARTSEPDYLLDPVTSEAGKTCAFRAVLFVAPSVEKGLRLRWFVGLPLKAKPVIEACGVRTYLRVTLKCSSALAVAIKAGREWSEGTAVIPIDQSRVCVCVCAGAVWAKELLTTPDTFTMVAEYSEVHLQVSTGDGP